MIPLFPVFTGVRIAHLFVCPRDDRSEGYQFTPVRPSVWIQVHGLSDYLLLQFLSYILQDVCRHNGGVQGQRIFISGKYSQNDRKLDLVIFGRRGHYWCPTDTLHSSFVFCLCSFGYFLFFVVFVCLLGLVFVPRLWIFCLPF